MFDSVLEDLDAAGVAATVEADHRMVVGLECRQLRLAAHWADLHHPDSAPPEQRSGPGAEQARQWGGDGTPEVLEFAPAELGVRLETTIGAARALMADALDLRHRFPILWRLVESNGVRAWKARKVAQATRHLDLDAAGRVDRSVAHLITSLAWGRFEVVLAGKIIEADPAAAEEQAKIWEAERFVRASTTRRSGLKLLVAQAAAGDVIVFMATVNRIAEILRLRGDLDEADVRRSKAIGILAQPTLAVQLLWDHRDEQHPDPPAPGPDEPVGNDPDAPHARSTEPSDDDTPDEADSSHEADPSAARYEPARHGLVVAPPVVDPARCRPRVVLYLHLSEEALTDHLAGMGRGRSGRGAVGRLEGAGPVTVDQIRRFLSRTMPDGDGEDMAAFDIRVQPVIDLSEEPAADSYEIPDRIREAMFLRLPGSVFPWSPSTGRGLDLDHTIPFRPPDRGGPPGQTGVGGLGPFWRTEHRVKTHGHWQFRQPAPGVFLCRSRYGAVFLITNTGTMSLGDNAYSHALWEAADPAQQEPAA